MNGWNESYRIWYIHLYLKKPKRKSKLNRSFLERCVHTNILVVVERTPLQLFVLTGMCVDVGVNATYCYVSIPTTYIVNKMHIVRTTGY